MLNVGAERAGDEGRAASEIGRAGVSCTAGVRGEVNRDVLSIRQHARERDIETLVRKVFIVRVFRGLGQTRHLCRTDLL